MRVAFGGEEEEVSGMPGMRRDVPPNTAMPGDPRWAHTTLIIVSQDLAATHNHSLTSIHTLVHYKHMCYVLK